MGHVLCFRNTHPIRERLIARLVRQVADDHRHADDPTEVLRACIGAALAHDLSDAETHWLMSGVEAQLGLWLTPMAHIA